LALAHCPNAEGHRQRQLRKVFFFACSSQLQRGKVKWKQAQNKIKHGNCSLCVGNSVVFELIN